MKRKLSFLLILILLGMVLSVWLAGSRLSAPAPQTIGELPADLHGRSIEFPSGSGTIIHGWFVPGERGSGAVLLLHGVRSNRLSMLERARFLNRAGYSVMLIDFQAHGESPGQQITFGYLESKDARAAVEYLGQLALGEELGVLGVSMGGAAALLGNEPLAVNALVLEMVYPAIEEAVGNRLAMRLGNWSRVFSPVLTAQLRFRIGIPPAKLRPVDRISEVKTPKLIIAGAEDRHTTIEETRQLYAAARDPKEMWIVPGASHQDLHSFAPQEYEQRVLSFFLTTLRQ